VTSRHLQLPHRIGALLKLKRRVRRNYARKGVARIHQVHNRQVNCLSNALRKQESLYSFLENLDADASSNYSLWRIKNGTRLSPPHIQQLETPQVAGAVRVYRKLKRSLTSLTTIRLKAYANKLKSFWNLHFKWACLLTLSHWQRWKTHFPRICWWVQVVYQTDLCRSFRYVYTNSNHLSWGTRRAYCDLRRWHCCPDKKHRLPLLHCKSMWTHFTNGPWTEPFQ